MTRKLLYLVNPISGVRKKPQLKAAISKRTSEAGIAFEIEETRADGNYTHLRKRIEEEKFSDIIICGGDGSVSTVTSYLLDTDVSIGILPMGSGNGLALAAGIPYSTMKALDIILAGHSAFIDGFYINDKFSCMMCGIGNDAQVAHEFATQKKRGLITYLRLSALNYLKSRCFPFSVRVGDLHMDTDAYFIVIANSNQFGNNVTIAPKASLTDGLLDIVVVRKMNKILLPFALLSQITGQNAPKLENLDNQNGNVLYFQAAALEILNLGAAPVHIDGEPETTMERIKIQAVPNAFRLLQPA